MQAPPIRLRFARTLLARAVLGCGLMLLTHCADDAPEIEGHRKVSELGVAECDALSTWTLDLADERLPARGSPVVCNGVRGAVQWTVMPSCPLQPRCPTTVMEFRRCMPALFDMMRERFCTLIQNPAAFADAISELSECRNACAEVLGQRSGTPAFLRFASP